MLTIHTFLPYVPSIVLPQGITGKPHEPVVRRRITDAGVPRAPLVSPDCTSVVPVNVGVHLPLPDGCPLMPPEPKPASDVTVNDAGNLDYVSREMALDGFAPHEYLAYIACEDFKAFFNQFVLHPSEWSSFCLAFLRDGDLYIASERVLCFGCAPSSGIAQRFAHLVRSIVTERMIAADAPFVADIRRRAGTHLRAWFAQRDALSAETGRLQALFFHISIYTDDAGQGAVGCARMELFLKIWTEACAELCIECAAEHKRSLCTFALNLSVILCLNLSVLLPTAKVISAASDLTDVCSGEPVPFTQCRKAFDLVCHFCDALGIPRATMYGMYADFREGSKEPNALIRPSPATIAACKRWLVILRTRICGSFTPELRSGRTVFRGPTQVTVYTDASEEGLCGFCHGYYFKLCLSRQWAAPPQVARAWDGNDRTLLAPYQQGHPRSALRGPGPRNRRPRGR
jgi:hypothetical protein